MWDGNAAREHNIVAPIVPNVDERDSLAGGGGHSKIRPGRQRPATCLDRLGGARTRRAGHIAIDEHCIARVDNDIRVPIQIQIGRVNGGQGRQNLGRESERNRDMRGGTRLVPNRKGKISILLTETVLFDAVGRGGVITLTEIDPIIEVDEESAICLAGAFQC